MEEAIFAAGCFWGVEAAFRQIPGVLDTEVGYTGGRVANPTYQDVCYHNTGHAEAVRVEFDPQQITFGELVNVFWQIHDPTTMNRQGPDVGSQYRSAIFYKTEQQKTEAETAKKKLDASGALPRPIVTEVTAAGPFWRAEEYHQRYAEKRGMLTCH